MIIAEKDEQGFVHLRHANWAATPGRAKFTMWEQEWVDLVTRAAYGLLELHKLPRAPEHIPLADALSDRLV